MSAEIDFVTVTETPGTGATEEQLAMMYSRYRWAADHAIGKEVLDVACGAGMGLGLLASGARRVVGADYSEALLQTAAAHYGKGVRLVRLDAHGLPFREASFDVALLFEAIRDFFA